MNNSIKSITTALLALTLSVSVFTVNPVLPSSSSTTTAEAASVKKNKKKAAKQKKIKKIKAENRKKINAAKRLQIRKNNNAKAVKANDKQMKKLNAQKRAQQKRINALNKTIATKKSGMYVATPNTDINDPFKADQGRHAIRRIENLPSKVTDPKVPANRRNDAAQYPYYGYIATSEDKSAKINGKLTIAQQKEISDYALTLVNSYLKTLGLAPVKRSANMDSSMYQLITRRENAKIGFEHTSDSFGNKTFNNSSGLFYNGENLGGITAPTSTTMLQLKVGVLNSISSMIYHDGASDWGHRENFKRSSGKQVSAGIEINNGVFSDWFGYMFVYGSADELGNVKMKNEPLKFTSTHRKNVSPAKDIAALNATKKNLARTNKKIKVRNAELNRVMKKKFKINGQQFNKTKQSANRVMANKLRHI